MNTSTQQQPLQIVVTDAGQESLLLRRLLRAALDVLQRPANVSPLQKIALAQAIESALHRPEEVLRIARYGRHWAVYASDGSLVCLTVYRKGAREVVRRLQQV